MRNSVKKELAFYILDKIKDRVINDENAEDWHFHLFNEDYYIIGYYEAKEWLRNHQIDAFEAIGICQEWEEDTLGEKQTVYDNAETTVNMLVYVFGEELLNEIDADNIEQLLKSLNSILENEIEKSV